MPARPSSQERVRQAFFTLAVRQLPKLYRLIRRQLTAYETAVTPRDPLDAPPRRRRRR